MAFAVADRVRETTTTTGTGTLDLAGAVSGFRTFVSGIGDGNVTYYAIVHRTAAEFEIGIGTVTDASTDTLSRTTILSSSNSNSAVSFSAGTKDVFCTQPASKAVFEDNNADVTLPDDLILGSDSAVLKFGADSDTTLTHTDGTGLTLNSTNKLTFNDTGTFIHSNADGDLDLVSDGTAVDSINLESAGGITLDAGTAGSGVVYEDDGTEMMRIHNSSSDVILETKVSDKDFIVKGNDGGSTITALTLDMSAAGAATFNDKIVATELDISGDVDVDGTANLDVVDIDGAVDMASTLGVSGVVTANAGVVVDNITIDGTEIDLSSGDLTVDVAGDIILDADGGNVTFKDGGTSILDIANSSTDVELTVSTADKNFAIKGTDGSSAITALDIDMALAGKATFSGDVVVTGDLTVSGDDITMGTNTAGNLLIADGTNFNSIAVGGLSEISTVANDDVFLAVDTSGGGLKKITRSTIVSGLAVSGAAISNVVEDTTPQLGGSLDVNGEDIVSVSNGNITLTPNGTGVVRVDGSNGIDMQSGAISIKNSGAESYIRFYCESSNAHYTQLQAAPHSAYSGNVTVVLPASADTLVGRATTDTLTNKTLTTPVIAEIDNSSDITLDAGADIILDADGANIIFKDGGTSILDIANNSSDVELTVSVADKNFAIKGTDGSSAITALDIDMALAGKATFNGAVVVGGDLTVNGTTTTVNSTTVTIDDPIFTLGGDTAPGSDDNKDRGIEFRYHNGSAAKVGFFGYDDSASKFTFIADASNSSEVFSGSAGDVAFGAISATSLDADGGVTVDNITIDGTEIDLSSGDLTVDVAGDIILDADGANITFKDGGTSVLDISNSSTDAVLTVSTQDKDLIIKGDDGGSAITAATFDMSDAGTLVLNHDIRIADGGQIGSASDADAIAIASNGVVTFTQAPVFPDGSIAIDDLDIDGGTDIGADLVDADEIIVDDGGGGTNRRSDLTRVKKYIYSAMSGDATASDAGALTIANDAIESGMLNDNIISGQTALTSGLATTDELLISDGGTIKRMDVSVLSEQFAASSDVTALAIALG